MGTTLSGRPVMMQHVPYLWIWLLAAPIVLGAIDLVTTKGGQTAHRR